MRDLDVNDFIFQPFSEASDTFLQLASSLEARVGNGEDIDFGERMAYERAQVLGELSERIVAALEAMYEDQEQGFPHSDGS
jgi:hypothetical protein